ncbi:UPF0481 protein At3g47200-like [Vigna unguiculata]|uniref:UPF0481 protein At3g47200-like n=1 Tax=Vigna unguiculata TaxID=3917 RepID=UPI0010167044|nr:UPF0481 protein At3g47200-like [Vigna unguiculata]
MGRQSRESEIECLEREWCEMLQDVKPPEEYPFDKQCIYKVPPKIRETNPKAYTPRIVSIGPYHRKAREVGEEDNSLEEMEELKLTYLKGFLNRTQLPMRELVLKIKELEEKIRNCYAAAIKCKSGDFLKMILVDACFIIELFLRWDEITGWVGKDPLIEEDWMRYDIKVDLLLLENQLPFFVLEELYNLMTGMTKHFLEITFKFFESVSFGKVCPRESPEHFTDLLRSSVISSSKLDLGRLEEFMDVKQVYSASQLMEAGLKFKISPNKSLLDLTYSKRDGALTMPILDIYDETEIVFRNIMAYEHCKFLCRKTISQYATILDFLINTEKDVNLLVDKKIIVNWTGDANKVVTMINNLCSHLILPGFNPHYFSLCNSLNAFYENPRNKRKAIFMHQYFNTPWKKASTISAIVILLFTFIQTLCSIISVFRGK